MHLSSVLLFGLGLTSGASSYVITIFTEADCKGSSKRINVWDNTCSTPNFSAAQSVRVEKYGGGGQKARFYRSKACLVNEVHRGPWDAGKSDHSWWAGNCLNMGQGYTVAAFSSYSS